MATFFFAEKSNESLPTTVSFSSVYIRCLAALAPFALLTSLGGCGGVNVIHKQKLELRQTALPLQTFAFPSGLRVVVERDTRTALAGVFVVVGSGSSSDPAGKEGLAHYVEHLAFQSRPFGADSFSDLFDKSGSIERNAFTGFDSTTYYEIGPASALPQLLRVEAVRMVMPVSNIPAETRALELDVVRNELRERNETGFVGEVYSRLQAALFPPGHPYARPIGGSHQSLSTLAKEDVDAFAKAHYRPDNMTVVVIGNIDLDAAEKLLADSLPEALVVAPKPVQLPQRLAATPPPVPDPAPRPAELPKVEAAIASPELWIGWALPRGFDRDGYLLSFLVSAARRQLSRAGLDDRDIAHVEVFPVPGKEASMLLCRVALQTGSDPEKTLAKLLTEAPKIVNEFLADPNDAEISSVINSSRYTYADMAYSRARRTILIGELLKLQNLVDRGVRRATVTHFSQDPALLSRALHDLGELKAERFHDYALPYLTAGRARAVLFVPKSGSAGGGAAEAAEKPAPPGGDRSSKKLPAPPDQWTTDLVTSPAQLSTRRLQNGLTVVLEPRAGLPLLTASLSLKIGPAAAKDAASIAFARAMARPASTFNNPAEYGGNPSSSGGDDWIAHRVEGSSGNAEGILATLAEHVRTMRIERRDSIYFKDFVLPSYQRLEKEPHYLAARDFFSSVLPDNPYGHLPKPEEIAAASYDATTQWLGGVYSPENATLVVVGDFEPKDIQAYIDDSFGGWKGSAATPPPQRPAAQPTGRVETRILTTPRPGGTQGELRFGCQLPEVTTGPMAVRHDLSAEVARNRLWQILRERLGATYGVHAQAARLSGGTAYLDLHANVENGKLAAALGELHQLLEQLAGAPAAGDALLWAKYREASSVALDQMTNGAVASSIFRRSRLALQPELAAVRQEIASVSAQDIQADYQYCLGAHPTLSIVGEESVVKAALKQGWK